MSNIELLNQLLNLTIWKTIEDYENYEVSICCTVRNIKTKRVLKLRIGNHGYYYVLLSNNGNQKYLIIHRLVAIAFIPNIKNNKFVDHIDSNRLNNTISNLRWCDLSENQHNRQLNENNTSGVKGIYWDKNASKWHAQIKFKNKLIYLGLFDNLEDAKNVRQKKANELFGQYTNACEIIIIV